MKSHSVCTQNFLKLKFLLVASFALSASLSACITSVDKGVELNLSPADDTPYAKALRTANRHSTVYNNFEVIYIASATYLSPEFRVAMAKRYETLFREAQPLLEEATAKAGFFVSLYTPDRTVVDLTNTRLWSAFLKIDDQSRKPILIKKLSEKERWKTFFPEITPWSQEFLVLFDSPSITPQDPAMVGKSTVGLLLANAEAAVNFVW